MDGVKLGCGMFIVLPLIILGIIAFAFHGCGSTVSGFVNARKQSQARRIINDARQLDSAIDMWAIAKGHKDGNAVNTVEAAVYLKGQAWMSNDILNNPYSFGNVGTNQVTISSETKTALDGVGVDWGNF